MGVSEPTAALSAMQHIALKNLNQISHIALDIETLPNRPLTDYEPTV
jgi:hypothetical protein